MNLFTSINRTDDGETDVSINAEGKLQIYPTGIGNGICLIMSRDDWRDLVATVDAVTEK